MLTNLCNLRCTYCYAEGGERPIQNMPHELAFQTIDLAAANAEKAGRSHFALVFHGGGEPTQNWDLLTRSVDHAKSKPLQCGISMSSNGVWSPFST